MSDQILLINKPYDWTSFDVVKKVRNMLKEKKIGHAGTLDPLATGLLILCTGKMTKQVSEIQDAEKEYKSIHAHEWFGEKVDIDKLIIVEDNSEWNETSTISPMIEIETSTNEE